MCNKNVHASWYLHTAKLTQLKISTQEEITQTNGADSEHKHSEIEWFSTLYKRIMTQTQKTPSLSIVSKFSDLH